MVTKMFGNIVTKMPLLTLGEKYHACACIATISPLPTEIERTNVLQSAETCAPQGPTERPYAVCSVQRAACSVHHSTLSHIYKRQHQIVTLSRAEGGGSLMDLAVM